MHRADSIVGRCWICPASGAVFPPLLTKIGCGLVVLVLGWRACAADLVETNAVASPPAADRQTPSLDELMGMTIPIVTGASLFEQKTTEAPASVTIITAEEIKRYGHRTLADVLRTVPGLYITYDRNYTFLGVRGFNQDDENSLNSRVLLLVNGHRVNNNLTDGAFIGTAFILDVDLIDHVEVIRGPGSVLYGNNAFFGVINVVTRKGGQLKGGEVSGEVASFDTYKGRLTYGNRFTNGLELLLSGTLYDSVGPNPGTVRRLDDDGFASFFGSVGFKGLTLEGAFITRDKGNPTAQFVTLTNDARLRTIDQRGYARLKYNHDFTNVVELTTQVYYDRNDYSIRYPFANDSTLDKEVHVGEWWGAEAQLTKRLFDRHIVTLGAEYRDDFRQSLKYYTNVASPPSLDRHRSSRNYGVYLEGDFTVVPTLHLNAGGRYDQYEDFDPTFNPRVALIYNPVKDPVKDSVFKAIYGTAFRAPNFVEPILAFPATGLAPEKITSYELVYEQGISKHLRSSVAGYLNRIDGLITFESGSFKNQDADARGVELGLEGIWAHGLRGRVSYSYQVADDRATGRTLTDSPAHLAKANLIVPLYREKVFAGLEYQFTSQRHTVRLIPGGGGLTTPGNDAAGFGVVNVTLFSQHLLKGLELSATVYNLLDKRYGDPASSQHFQDIIEQDGRTFRVKVTYRF